MRHRSKEVGYLDPISLLTPARHFATVLLAGRVWQVTSVDWQRRFAWVEPVEGGGQSRWLGDGRPLSSVLCDAMRNVLAGADPEGVTLTQRASQGLDQAREAFGWVHPGRTAVVAGASGPVWWTFAGLHANAGLTASMGSLLGGVKLDNLQIKLNPEVDSGAVEKVLAFADEFIPSDVSPSWIAEDLASKLKFADALPDDLAIAIATARLADRAGVARVISEPIDAGVGGP